MTGDVTKTFPVSAGKNIAATAELNEFGVMFAFKDRVTELTRVGELSGKWPLFMFCCRLE